MPASHFVLPTPAENALSHLQDTTLTPMEEALFKAWTKANKIDKPDNPDDHVDYRGIYKATGGLILPNGKLAEMAGKVNSEDQLQNILAQKMHERTQAALDSVKSKQDQMHNEQRQDINHQQKMEQGAMKLQHAPHEAKMKELQLQQAHVGNEGKRIDAIKAIFAPKPQINPTNPAGQPDATGSIRTSIA